MKEITAIVFDTETTGLIKPDVVELEKQPRIIELYCAKVIHRSDGVIEQVDELDTYLNVPNPLDAIITKITGINDEMLKGAPTFVEKFQEIAEFHVGADRWVAHNLAFDSAMMGNEISRLGKVLRFPFPPEHVCTVQKTMHIEQRRMSLTNLHRELFGTEFEAHRAKSDVMALLRCYKEVCKRGWIK